MAGRRDSNTDIQIHVNPNRNRTPTPLPLNFVTRASNNETPGSVQEEETTVDNQQSETIIIPSRENTPVPNSYGTMEKPSSERTPLLKDQGLEEIDSESDIDENNDLPFFSKTNLLKNKNVYLRQLKVGILCIAAFLSVVFIVINNEEDELHHQLCVCETRPTNLELHNVSYGTNTETISLILEGPFSDVKNESYLLTSLGASPLTIDIGNHTDRLFVSNDLLANHSTVQKKISVDMSDLDRSQKDVNITFIWESNGGLMVNDDNECVPISYHYVFTTSPGRREICAAIVLVLVYALIIFELVHRTLAAMLGSLAAVAVLSAFGMRPTLEKILTWLDVETLSLLFGMMIIVAIFSETGFFDYCALQAYRLAKGQVWPLITLLCVFSAVVSAFLDNVTTILLLTPVTIRLCEVLNLDPRKILIAEVVFSNIGGTATAIGDPPNVIIVSNKDVIGRGIDFSTFTVHATVGILFISVVAYGLLRLIYRKMEDLENKDPIEISELRHEIEIWRRAALRMVPVSREEHIMKAIFSQRVAELENKLNKKIYKMKRKKQKNFKEMLKDLEKRYRITNKSLLVKSGVVLLIVILSFFLHSFITEMHVGLGWISLMGAMMLMVLSDIQELETIIHRVEWTTLIFFAALFSLMEALNELGLIDWIGEQVQKLIQKVEGEDNKLLVAILLIVWVSALASSFIDNIPFTTAMIPVLIILENDTSVPLLPMVMALAFGACLGGNGTLIGASANVVAAGIAEQHGYGFSFTDFFRVGFPMMLVTTFVSTIYLLICHVAGSWGNDL